MKKLRWVTNKEQADYIRGRRDQNLKRALANSNENWAAERLEASGVTWTRQAIWGMRLFDFWNAHLGCAVEIDGPEHDPAYDGYRDEYNFRRSGVVVLRVRNRNERDIDRALLIIARLEPVNVRKHRLGIAGSGKRIQRTLSDQPYEHSMLREFLVSVERL